MRKLDAALVAFVAFAAVAGPPAPAFASCCPLERIDISVPGHARISITLDRLDDRLDDSIIGMSYGPVLYGYAKGDHRPTGDLSTGYDVVYVLRDANDEPTVEARERVYPFAEGGPVGYTPPGQAQRFDPRHPPRPIEPGWRPFSEELVEAIFGSLDRVTPSGLLAQARRGEVAGSSRLWVAAGLTVALTVSIRRVLDRPR